MPLRARRSDGAIRPAAEWRVLSEEDLKELELWAGRPEGRASIEQITQSELDLFVRDLRDAPAMPLAASERFPTSKGISKDPT
jgi:hypothetical protein